MVCDAFWDLGSKGFNSFVEKCLQAFIRQQVHDCKQEHQHISVYLFVGTQLFHVLVWSINCKNSLI